MLSIDSEFYLVKKDDLSGNMTVTEGYKKAPEFPFSVHYVASWSNSGDFHNPQPEKYERRSNLSGITFDIVTLKNVRKRGSFSTGIIAITCA